MQAKTIIRSALPLCLMLVTLRQPFAQQPRTPTGEEVTSQIRTRTAPLGYGALKILNEIKQKPFKENVQFSNQWIQGHIDHYDKSSNQEYRAYVKEMIDGGGDVELGMRKWLSDPGNVAWWDNAIRQNVGDQGYARVVALNAGFPSGSDDYRVTFGGFRRYDVNANTMSLNGTSRTGGGGVKGTVVAQSSATRDQRFAVLTKLGDAVRQQMFNFYDAFSKGKVSADQVKTFNEALVWGGGCAITDTDSFTTVRSERYLAALNHMANTMDALGYQVAR